MANLPTARSAACEGEHTIVERYGETQAVLVPYTWWAEQQERANQGTLAP
ncbi:hypothetical protein [Streptosporangium sp. NPDC049644]